MSTFTTLFTPLPVSATGEMTLQSANTYVTLGLVGIQLLFAIIILSLAAANTSEGFAMFDDMKNKLENIFTSKSADTDAEKEKEDEKENFTTTKEKKNEAVIMTFSVIMILINAYLLFMFLPNVLFNKPAEAAKSE